MTNEQSCSTHVKGFKESVGSISCAEKSLEIWISIETFYFAHYSRKGWRKNLWNDKKIIKRRDPDLKTSILCSQRAEGVPMSPVGMWDYAEMRKSFAETGPMLSGFGKTD